MAEEKDRLGEKLRDLERGREDDYFARRDRELIEKLRKEKEAAAEAAEREGSRGRCPRCGTKLTQRALQGITVDECPACGGVWLDRGELETLAGEVEPEGSWLVRLLRSSIMMR